MTIRSKAILAIILTFTAILLTLLIICRYILIDNLLMIEENNARQNIERINKWISYGISHLASTAADWSYWDETYNFASNHNPEYVEANLADSTFVTLHLNLVILIDKTGAIIFNKAFDRINSISIPIPDEYWLQLAKTSQLLSADNQDDCVTGLLSIEKYPPILIATCHILNNDKTAPVNGTLIFGRFLDSLEIRKLSDMTFMPISIIPINDPEIHNDYDKHKITEEISIKPVDNNNIVVYSPIKDLYGKTEWVLKAEIQRDIYREGQNSVMHMMVSVSFICILFGVIAVAMAELQGLRRLKQLTLTVEKIAISGKISSRVPISGKDEISRLGSNINRMFASLEQSEETIRERAKNLQLAVIEADLANKTKTEFLSSMSHELRTPLTAIIGLAQLLQKKYYGVLNDKQSEYVKDILESSNHLLSLINDILDLAKVEAGKVKMEMDGVAIRELIGSSILIVKESATKKGLDITVDIAEEVLNQSIVVDKRRIRQVLINLLSNAIKFTSAGGKITISAVIKPDVLEVSVLDSGIGINLEEQNKIFGAFYQTYSGTTGKSPGTGLGLSISKRLVEQHQGKIWVESEGIGKGSRFTFTISLLLQKRPAETKAEKTE